MVARSLHQRLRLYLITPEDACSRPRYEDVLRGSLAGGVGAVQLRLKEQPVRVLLDFGRRLRAVAAEFGALFIVNDRVDVALALGADGVHLGDEDLPVATVRALAPEILIGATVRNPEQARAALAAGASYLGCGAVFPSATKSQVPVAGLKTLAAVAAAVPDLPVVGIGGIGSDSLPAVLGCGAAGVAAIAAFDAPDRKSAEARARAFLRSRPPS